MYKLYCLTFASLFMLIGTALLTAGEDAQSYASLAEKLGVAPDESVMVSRFSISGNSVFPESDLHRLIASWENKELAMKDISQVIQTLKTHYQTNGYAYADVTVPAQKIENGVLLLEVLEGRINAVKIQGNRRYSSEFLSARLDALAPGQILSMPSFEREVILLNSLPGLKAQVNAIPSGEPGLFDVTVAVSEDWFQGQFLTDNDIQTDFGPWETKLRLSFSNLTKHGDSFTVEPSALKDKWPNGILFMYSLPVGNDGTSLSLNFLQADVQFISNSPLMGLQNDVTYTIAQVSHPLKLSFLKNIMLNTGFVRVTSAYLFNNNQLGPTETLNILTVALVYMQGRPGASTTNAFAQFSTNFRRNPDGARNNAEPGRLDLVAGHEHWFTPDWSLFVFGIGVLSVDPLLTSQKVTIGGPFCVRGYNVNEAVGDQGYLVKTELKRQIKHWPKVPITLKVMLDDAQVFRKISKPGESGSDHLISAGAGLSLQFAGRYNFSLDWADRLNDHPVKDGKKAGRFWFSFSAPF